MVAFVARFRSRPAETLVTGSMNELPRNGILKAGGAALQKKVGVFRSEPIYTMFAITVRDNDQ